MLNLNIIRVSSKREHADVTISISIFSKDKIQLIGLRYLSSWSFTILDEGTG